MACMGRRLLGSFDITKRISNISGSLSSVWLSRDSR